MTTDIKELVTYIRSVHEWCARTKSGGDWFAIDPDESPFKAADALEALAGEVERLTKSEEGLLKALGLERREKHAAQTERDRLKAALEPFARFAKMFAEAREHKQGHAPVEPNAEWYARETKQGVYVLTPGMFDEALRALGDAS